MNLTLPHLITLEDIEKAGISFGLVEVLKPVLALLTR
jgi:hypothetical protein